MKYICQYCNKTFHRRSRGDRTVKYCSIECSSFSKKGKPSWNKGIPCKESTKKKLSKLNKGKRFSPHTEFQKGVKPHNFAGEFISNGYIYCYAPLHPFCSKRGYVLKHRLVAENILKRFLTPEEVIHHIDEDPTNNNPSNLYLFSNNVEHLSHHRSKAEIKSNL